MGWLRRLFGERESCELGYGTEVLCSNWVAQPLDRPAAPGSSSAAERLRETDALTFLARIYASQRC